MALNNIIFNDMFHVHIMITAVMCNVHWHYQTDLSLLSDVVCWYAYFLLSYIYELIVIYWHERSALQLVAAQAVDWQLY